MSRSVFLSGNLAESLPKFLYLVGFVCLSLCGYLFYQDSHHFSFSYLTAFSFYMALSLGAMFFVLIQFLVRSGWSVTVRRIAEHLMKNVWVMLLFFIPIVFS